MNNPRYVLAVPFRLLMWAGVLCWIIGSIVLVGWYIEWLDTHFLWRLVADMLGFLTLPLAPLATIIEWLWHGWPSDVTFGFSLVMAGMTAAALFRWLALLLSGEN